MLTALDSQFLDEFQLLTLKLLSKVRKFYANSKINDQLACVVSQLERFLSKLARFLIKLLEAALLYTLKFLTELILDLKR